MIVTEQQPAPSPARDLLVSETFGPTFQGEGVSSGQQALFVRLAACNLSCRWCDTPFTWDWSTFDRSAETQHVSIIDLVRWAAGFETKLVVVTGGEPLLQRDRLTELAILLEIAGKRVEIETNGTLVPGAALAASATRFNVSVKLAHSGVTQERRIRPDAIRALADMSACNWKFVVQQPGDLDEIADLEARFGLEPIWVMPAGTQDASTLAVMRALADEVLVRGWNLTPRLHILLWGDIRGR
ncbi:7-carboxy-7-deazaguanine synthase QueE [Frankia sp. Ag45/Mut15]|uniref:7-carboxy-7-deazaguanine synthase n=1 Tax=Frankia umida TaxID=573489 RepID=A0ABT0K3B6_9ACTN|nr:7-carboxy-7-deazaguanine synthase QueE [Frankia umida]MCK9878270.1 7-carboxy-7-deazaguanine synthase QueE [Frankia umida]